jgi:hypothetical protein
MDFKVTFDLLPVASFLLVFLGYYLPGFKTWFGGLTEDWKQGFMVLVLLICGAGAVALSAFGVINVYPLDWKLALMPAFVDFIIALSINAGIYKGTNYINNRLTNKNLG